MNDCIFCAIVTGESPSLRVAESELAIALLDVNPANLGHSLVLPKRHADDIWDLSAQDGVFPEELQRVVRPFDEADEGPETLFGGVAAQAALQAGNVQLQGERTQQKRQ